MQQDSRPSEPEVLSDSDLIEEVEVQAERKSLLHAAANARSITMLTGTHGVVSLPIERPRVRLPSPEELAIEGTKPEVRESDDPASARARARVAVMAAGTDSIGELRARLELAHARLEAGDEEGARAEATAAAAVVGHAPAAHAMLRSLASGRSNIDAQLTHVEHLRAHAVDDRARADWLVERGRLLEAKSEDLTEAISAYRNALALVANHPAALFGLEAALEATAKWEELADHLGRLATFAGEDTKLAAWLEVERALVLDRRLNDRDAARAAFDRALALDPGIGPVRQACVDHAVQSRDDDRLALLLEQEAGLENDTSRAASLELDAALAFMRSGADRARVVALLERAHGRAPTTPLVDGRIAEELARLHDGEGKHSDALRVRKKALRSIEDPREQQVTLRAIAADAERVQQLDDAITALESARATDPNDATLLADLDRVLTTAGKQDARAVLWMREAALADDPNRKSRALLLSAQAAKASGRDAEAARQLQAAWIAAPSAPGVYDAMADRLQAPGAEAAVKERIALYEQAIRTTKDPDRKIYFLEKIAWLYDDVAGDTVSAVRAYEDVLAIEPARMSAISGLASAATRANDDRALARALLSEADITADPAWRVELQLRAAEAVAELDAERALALADALRAEAPVAARAAELVTRIHSAAGRWELVVKTLLERASTASEGAKMALHLAAADVATSRLRSPGGAIAILEDARRIAPDDPTIAAALIAALEADGDAARLRKTIEEIAEGTSSPRRRAALYLRAAEIDETTDDARALATYRKAREALPDEALLRERVVRLAARTKTKTSDEAIAPLTTALRQLETDESSGAEPLLATGARDVATLRLAERFARRTKSAPQLANALAMQADALRGTMAERALEGLAKLVAWTLPESDDYEPWERLVALGSKDVAVLDTVVRRAWPKVLEGDMRAVEVATLATYRRINRASDETEALMLGAAHVRLLRRAGRPKDAADAAKKALAIDETCLSVACALAELATELVDRKLAILSAKALATVTKDAKARAEIMRDAADLALADKDRPLGAELLVKALDADPDAVLVAARLAELEGSLNNWYELARTLRRALRAAKTKEAIIPMASELADVARNRVKDPLLAIEALSRAREVAPEHVPTLFVLSELFIGQRSWQEALVALQDVIDATNEPTEKLVALVGRASIYRRVLERAKDAERELRAALEIEPHDPRAIRGLLDLGQTIPAEERVQLLTRLVVAAHGAPDDRRRALLELAETRRSLGDHDGAEGALVEAAALNPDAAMFDRLRAMAGADPTAQARVLGRALARAKEGGKAPGLPWLLKLGELELELGRADSAAEHFEEALRLDATRDDARIALARALAKKGRHETAAAALAPLLDAPNRPTPLDANFVRLLESTLSGAGRQQQAWVARELRSIAGDLDANARAELDNRRSFPPDANLETLPASSLRSFVMPGGLGRHPIWDVAPVAAAFGGKAARIALGDQGVSSRDRIKPKAVSALRQLFDRMARAFEIAQVELAASDHIAVPSVAVEDEPWIVVPSSIADWPEPWAVAALARPFARIALGVPWIASIGAAETLAILVGFARQVAPSFGATPVERIEPLVGDYELRAKRAIDRRRRKMLDEMQHVLAGAPAIAEDVFADAVARTETRASFLLSGSLRATLDSLAPFDPSLGDALRTPSARALTTALSKPLARDVIAFGLGAEATALRRSLGTIA